MHIHQFREKFTRRLYLVSAVILSSAMTVAAAPPDDQVGRDAPHYERNLPKNADNFRVQGGVPVAVAVPAASPVPAKKTIVKKATAVSKAKAGNKSVAKEKEIPKESAKNELRASQTSTIPDDPRVGSNAPHQERGSDPDAHAGRLIIWDR